MRMHPKSSFKHVTDDVTLTHQTADGLKKRKVNQQRKRGKNELLAGCPAVLVNKNDDFWLRVYDACWTRADQIAVPKSSTGIDRLYHTHERETDVMYSLSSFVEWKMLLSPIYTADIVWANTMGTPSTCIAWLPCRKERGEEAPK